MTCITSDDNGLTWHDYAQSENSFVGLYAIGGCGQLTADGYVIGSFTERGRTGSLPKNPRPHRFAAMSVVAVGSVLSPTDARPRWITHACMPSGLVPASRRGSGGHGEVWPRSGRCWHVPAPAIRRSPVSLSFPRPTLVPVGSPSRS